MTSTREITTAMLGAQTPVVVYVAPAGAQAASAGFFILMAADVAAMAPGTNTGAAHPVGGQGEDIEGTMAKKMEQDAAANIRALAARNGRNVELAEAAVVESRSFTADEALEGKLIDLIAPSFDKLLEALDGRTVKQGDERGDPPHRAARPCRRSRCRRCAGSSSVIADPNIAYHPAQPGRPRPLLRADEPGRHPARRGRRDLPDPRLLRALGAAGELRRAWRCSSWPWSCSSRRSRW